MKKQIAWLMVSCFMVVALVLASCAPATPPEEEPAAPTEEKPTTPATEKPTTPVTEKPTTPATEKEMVRDALGNLVEKPQYGGVFRLGYATDPTYFDDTFGHPIYATTLMMTNEALMQGDWAKGPAGTGEASWLFFIIPPKNLQAGCLAEDWELRDDQTIVYHIRKGVHFHNKPPTNGREMTAEDVVFSLKRLWEVKTSIFLGNPYIESITAPDKWTVVVKAQPGKLGVIYRYATWYAHIVPHEVIEKYGNINQWENSCGTGPFILTDYVAGSSATFIKNPGYWGKDPLHPDNQIPYIDGLKFLIIPDVSTRMAALRTSKLDWLPSVSWEDAASVETTNPELNWKEYPSGGSTGICWLVNKPELPFYDKRVRRALHMAVDLQAIAKDFYGGHADTLNYPCIPIAEFKNYLPPLEQLPESVQELFSYQPEKAKSLLAEAGYPNGFKTSIVCWKDQVDLLSIVQANWANVGVTLDIQVKEYATYLSMGAYRSYDIFAAGLSCVVPDQYAFMRVGNVNNHSMVNDPTIEKAYADVTANYFDEDKRSQIMRESFPYFLDQAYLLQLPGPYVTTFWQPWVKNYHGEIYVGVWGAQYNFVNWLWLDEDLKQKVTGAE